MKIGVFDSGIGGLSIALEIKRQLPIADITYYGDSAYSPYGDLSVAQLQQRCEHIVEQLISVGCSLIVVACNTATVNCIKALRHKHQVAFVGVEPGIRPALLTSQNGRISVLATTRTIESEHYQTASSSLPVHLKLHDVKCVGLANAIEQIAISSTVCNILPQSIATNPSILVDFDLPKLIDSVIKHGSDVVVLGCTHYNLIKRDIQQILDVNASSAVIIDTAEAVVKQVVRIIGDQGHIVVGNKVGGNITFLTSGELKRFSAQIARWWPFGTHNIVHDDCQPIVPLT